MVYILAKGMDGEVTEEHSVTESDALPNLNQDQLMLLKKAWSEIIKSRELTPLLDLTNKIIAESVQDSEGRRWVSLVVSLNRRGTSLKLIHDPDRSKKEQPLRHGAVIAHELKVTLGDLNRHLLQSDREREGMSPTNRAGTQQIWPTIETARNHILQLDRKRERVRSHIEFLQQQIHRISLGEALVRHSPSP